MNARGEILYPRVLVNEPGDVRIIGPPASSPFDATKVPLRAISHFQPEPLGGHRLRTEGTVTYAVPGKFFHVQDGFIGVRVETRGTEPLSAGDRVEIAGFLDGRRPAAGIVEAIYRVVGRDEVALHVEGRPFEPPQCVAGNLMLIAQEAVRNAVNHARANSVRVDFASAEAADAVSVTVDDDGSGFALDEVAGVDHGHFGLQGMRERTEGVRGQVFAREQARAGHADFGPCGRPAARRRPRPRGSRRGRRGCDGLKVGTRPGRPLKFSAIVLQSNSFPRNASVYFSLGRGSGSPIHG